MGEKATPRPVLQMNFMKCMRVISRRSVLSGSYASKEGKLYGLAATTVSSCVIAISNGMDVVRQWGHRKKKRVLIFNYIHPVTLAEVQGRVQRAYTTVCMSILKKKLRTCGHKTNRLHCRLAMLLFLRLFGVPHIFTIL